MKVKVIPQCDSCGSENCFMLTPAEVAISFRVDPKTVTRWAQAGQLPSVRTLGGHRRYRRCEVLARRMEA